MRRCLLHSTLACCALLGHPAGAAIIGSHDVSDAVKTAGWVCDPADIAPLRVHLYAQIQGEMRWIDSQLANQRRTDLDGRCRSASHAFRFADYAANGIGALLYESALPVSLHVFAEAADGLQRLTTTARDVAFAPVGIWDPGLTDARWRTDLPDFAEGSGNAPLLLGDCRYTTPFSDGYPSFSGGGFVANTGCRYDQTTFTRSNAASSEAQWPMRSFWTVVANVEDALDNPLCTDGPPGQSLPIGAPGTGEVFGVVALPDVEAGRPERKKFHLSLNSLHWTACRERSYGGPYLGFAVQADSGNGGLLTYLNRPGAPTKLRFGMTLMDIAKDWPDAPGAPRDARRYSQAHILIEAMWGGVKRWVFVELIPDIRGVRGFAEGAVDAHVRFNWHLANSMMYPGADYVYKSGTVLTAQCAGEGLSIPVFDKRATYVDPATRDRSRIDYEIDLQRLFDCVNRRGEWGWDTMPAHAVPVTAVLFGIEQDDRFYARGEFTGHAAPNAIWIAVDSVGLQ